jgi:hypothetical protein
MKTVDFFEDDMDQQYIYAAKFSPSGKYIGILFNQSYRECWVKLIKFDKLRLLD